MGSLHEQQQTKAQEHRIQMLRGLERRLGEDLHVHASVLAAVRELIIEAEAEAGASP